MEDCGRLMRREDRDCEGLGWGRERPGSAMISEERSGEEEEGENR